MQPAAPPVRVFKRLTWLLLILVSLLVISLPTVLLLAFGLLPAVVAWIIDRSAQKYATFCVFGMNFSGLFPFLTDVWFKEHSIDAATRILTNPFDLTVIYGAAAFGWVIFKTVPPVVTTFMSAMLQHRVTTLREQQKTIIEEWGEGVSMLVDTELQQQAAAKAQPQKGRGRR
jgi:hypothetical protein